MLHDVSDQIRLEDTLRLREERLGSIVDSAPVGLVILTARGMLESANPAFCSLLGEELDSLLGQPFQEWVSEDLEDLLESEEEQA